jgi:hypothetical protein
VWDRIGYSRSYRPRCATSENGSRNARSSGLCLSALPLSPLSWPRPHGRTPTIPPVFLNVRRSTTRLQPLHGGGLVPPDNRKTRPESEPVAAATTIASGVIHGRNHAERIVHPQTLGEPADCPIAKRRGHLLVQSPLLSRRTMHAWSSDMKDRTADVCLCKALCVEVCSIFVLASRERQAIKVGPNTREGRRPGARRIRLDYDLQAW